MPITTEPDNALYARDLDGTGSPHICSKGDPGATLYFRADDDAASRIAILEKTLRAAVDHFDTPRMMPPETRKILDQMRGTLASSN